MGTEGLIVEKAYVDEGTDHQTGWCFALQGRAGRIDKRTSHITVIVSIEDKGGISRWVQSKRHVGLRVGIIRNRKSKCYGGKDYADLLHEDIPHGEFVKRQLKDAAVASIEIERATSRVNVTIHTAKPGMVIGKGGSEVEALRRNRMRLTDKKLHIDSREIKVLKLNATLVAENIAQQLERRISFRRAMKQAIQRTWRAEPKAYERR